MTLSFDTDPIAQWDSNEVIQPNTSNKKQTLFFIASLIYIQTNLNLTERSLSESWRARSLTQRGFDFASMTASTALGKL